MSVREDLRIALEALERTASRRGPPTEAEIEECVMALEEFRQATIALPNLTRSELIECSEIMGASMNTIITRLKSLRRRVSR